MSGSRATRKLATEGEHTCHLGSAPTDAPRGSRGGGRRRPATRAAGRRAGPRGRRGGRRPGSRRGRGPAQAGRRRGTSPRAAATSRSRTAPAAGPYPRRRRSPAALRSHPAAVRREAAGAESRAAPSAIRTPNSCVRCATRQDITPYTPTSASTSASPLKTVNNPHSSRVHTVESYTISSDENFRLRRHATAEGDLLLGRRTQVRLSGVTSTPHLQPPGPHCRSAAPKQSTGLLAGIVLPLGR